MRGLIADMLRSQKRHTSFHTPGHKRSGWDITELSYSDNLASPTGVIARAEAEVADILGAEKSFLLTDGSTCGVHAMLYCLKLAGLRSVACPARSHISVQNGCLLAGLECAVIPAEEKDGIPLPPTVGQMERALAAADALLLTSPDYYGNFPDLAAAKALCERAGKPLLIDGAHGAHLHFCENYAGKYAHLWVDGVHKSLPALTQGAVVSAKGKIWADRLKPAVALFRTTSPSYPILASVESSVRCPRNRKIEECAERFKQRNGAYPNADWSKIVIGFGEYCDMAQTFLEVHGIYPEFNDGNYLMFYLSPATREKDLKKLARFIKKLPRGTIKCEKTQTGERGRTTKAVSVAEAVGKTCARPCGIFPPCLPLIAEGERITAEKAARMQGAKYTFGLEEGKILVYTEE